MGKNGYMDGFDEKDSNDFEFSINPVIGIRGFRIDSLGRLTGWTFRSVWKSGENVATCGLLTRTDECLSHGPMQHRRAVSFEYMPAEYTYPTARTIGVRDAEYYHFSQDCFKPTECTDIENCSHGFWAYFRDIESGTIRDDTCTAVISGYGKTMIGTKGFRCEKARIEAIALPPVRQWKEEQHQKISEVKPTALYNLMPLLALPSVLIGVGINILFDISNPYAQWGALVGVYLVMVAALVGWINLKPVKVVENITETIELPPEDHPHIVNIMRNYPEVRIYTNLQEMLDDYPMVSNAPNDPSDPNFWTFDPKDEVIMRSKKSE